MSADAVRVHDITPLKRWMLWSGRILSALGILVSLMSARWKLTRQPFYVAEWGRIGYAESALLDAREFRAHPPEHRLCGTAGTAGS